MSKMTIGELAQRAGVSVRTLRHYDQINLLKPDSRASNAYRIYSAADSQRLYDILFYRALGFSLQEIARLLKSSQRDRYAFLLEQRAQLHRHMDRLQHMQAQLEQLIADQGEHEMSKENDFSIFDGFDPDAYSQEVDSKYGETDQYREAASRTRKYTKQDWARYKTESDSLNNSMLASMEKGLGADDEAVLEVIEKMRLQIDNWFYPCSRQMHASLGEMYVSDSRFEATYEKIGKGMAQFMRDATAANLNRR